MRLVEIEHHQKYHLVGTCVNSFDEDGDCTVDNLPWSNVTDFAHYDENATEITAKEFHQLAEIPHLITKITTNHNIKYLNSDGVLSLYDLDDDIHYFLIR